MNFMTQKKFRTALVAFKVEEDLADLLNQLPNKSDFIRRAIAAQIGTACPLCLGKGTIPRSMQAFFTEIIESHRRLSCHGCGQVLDIPKEPGDLQIEDRTRLDQFFLGGPLFCPPCYSSAPPCEACGWHIDADELPHHQLVAHEKDEKR
jgi:hypothetical protein